LFSIRIVVNIRLKYFVNTVFLVIWLDETITLREEIFAEKVFAEFNFVDFGPICEIWFFSFSEKRGSKWAKNEGERGKMGKIFVWKLLILEIKFCENFFP